MNRIYKVIFNRFLGLWQCVSELTKSHGKPSSTQLSLPLEQRAQPSVTGQTLVLCSPLKLTTLAVLGALSGMMALPAVAEDRLDVVGAMEAKGIVDKIEPNENGGRDVYTKPRTNVPYLSVDGNNKQLILHKNDEVWVNRGYLKNADLLVQGIYHLTNNQGEWGNTNFFSGTMVVDQGGQLIVQNDAQHPVNNNVHFDLGGGAGAASNVEMTVKDGGSVLVQHMFTLSGPGQTTLNINKGGSLKAVGLKLGQIGTGSAFLTGRTATLNLDGGKIDVTTIRGLTKFSNYSRNQYSNNTVKAEAHFSGGGEIVIGSMADDLGYQSTAYSSYDNSALFRFFYTEGKKRDGTLASIFHARES